MQLSTDHPALCRPELVTISDNHNREPVFALADIRRLACDPALLDACSAWAKRWRPRTTLARECV